MGQHKIRNSPSYGNGTNLVRYEIKIKQIKQILLDLLKENNLIINKNKTEKFKVKYQESNNT